MTGTRVRAAVVTSTSARSPFRESRPLTVEELVLAPPGPGEVMVRIGSAGLCHSDLSVLTGTLPRPVPTALGHEAAGVVEEVGEGVRSVAPGDQVVFSFVPMCGQCPSCISGRPALCEPGAATSVAGTLLSGRRPFSRPNGEPVNQHLGVSGFAERTVCDAGSLIKLPSDLPIEQGALFGCAMLTGLGAVFNTAHVEAGATVAVIGLGGVGMMVVMGAALAGARRIVAVDISADKFDLARKLGATDTVLSGPDTVEQVRALTGGVDFAFEAAGRTDTVGLAWDVTGRGGATVLIGLTGPTARTEFSPFQVVKEERRLLGSYMGSAQPARDIARYIDLFRSGRLPIDLVKGETFALDDINEAMDTLASGSLGRQLLVP